MSHAKQQGATLITALVMLIVLTLLVLSAIRSSTTNLRIAGNMQMQGEMVQAAQQAAEQIISYNFTANPTLAVQRASMATVGMANYTTTAAVVCTGSKPVPANTPNIPIECLPPAGVQNAGIIRVSGVTASSPYFCLAQQWDIRAQATDTRTGAAATIHQGVSLLVDVGTTCTEDAPQL
jgi:Tfp pilus assembly protein PilE